jgi:transcriptional regulator with XRE-family HTH domain
VSAAPSEPFGAAVARLMRERGVSYRALAVATGLSAGYLNHLVQGTRPTPSDEVMQRVAQALGSDATRFTEFRLRRLVDRLRARPGLVDRLYAETVQD